MKGRPLCSGGPRVSQHARCMTRMESARRTRPRSLTRVVVWTGVGLAGLAVLCAITAFAITPIANRAPTDDAPIVAADLLLVILAALAMMASAAVFAGLALGAALVGLWHHWRPDRGEQPQPPVPPPGDPERATRHMVRS